METKENDPNIRLLDEVKICPFTGKKYDAIIRVKCGCECHNPNVIMMHFMPCCDSEGYTYEFRYIN